MKFRTNYLKERGRRILWAHRGILAGALLLGLLLLINAATYVAYSNRVSGVKDRTALLAQQVRTYEADATAMPDPVFLARFKDEVAFANRLIDRKSFSWTRLLGRLEKHVPGGIAITRIAPHFKDGQVEAEIKLNGDADSLEPLTKLMMNLEGSPYFADVFLLRQSIKPVDGRDMISFELTVRYVAEGEGGQS